jgi:hypothetical protein
MSSKYVSAEDIVISTSVKYQVAFSFHCSANARGSKDVRTYEL